MRRDEPIHPVLVPKKRPYLVTSVLAVGMLGIAAAGYSVLSGRQALLPAASADVPQGAAAQAGAEPVAGLRGSGEGGKSARVAAAVELRNTVSRQASEWGVRRCLGQVARVSDFLTVDRDYTALSRRGERAGDAEVFTSTIAARDLSGIDSVSTFVSAPVGGQDCNSSYQTVASFATSCEAAYRNHFSGFDQPLAFGGRVRAYGNGRDSYVFLLPVGEVGCTAIKTQTIY